MSKPLTQTEHIGRLKLQGLSPALIAERLGVTINVVNVAWYRYRRPERARELQLRYQRKNREKITAYQRKWARENQDRIQEYRITQELRKAGVEYARRSREILSDTKRNQRASL